MKSDKNNIHDFLSLLKDEIDFEDDKVHLDENTNLRQTSAWTSMHALMLIAIVDEHFGVMLSGEDLANNPVIIDLYNLIINKQSA